MLMPTALLAFVRQQAELHKAKLVLLVQPSNVEEGLSWVLPANLGLVNASLALTGLRLDGMEHAFWLCRSTVRSTVEMKLEFENALSINRIHSRAPASLGATHRGVRCGAVDCHLTRLGLALQFVKDPPQKNGIVLRHLSLQTFMLGVCSKANG